MNHFTFTILFGLLCLLSVRAQSQEYTYADSWDQQGFILQKNQPDGVEINFSISRFALEDIVINGEAMKNINLPAISFSTMPVARIFRKWKDHRTAAGKYSSA
jgi:hypothetical protein